MDGETTVEGQVATEPKTEEIAQVDYKAEFEKSKQELEKWQKEAKAHQSNFSKADAELRALKKNSQGVDELREKLDILTSAVAEVVDRDADSDKPKIKEKIEQVNKTLKARVDSAKSAEVNGYAKQIFDLIKGNKLDPDGDEFAKAQNLFLRGKYEESVNEVRRVVESKTVKPEVKVDESAELKKQLEEANKLIKQLKGGSLDSEVPIPKGNSKSFQDIEKGYVSGEISFKEYSEARQKNNL